MTGSITSQRLAAIEARHQTFLARHAADMASVDEVIAQVDAKIRTTWDTIKEMADRHDLLAAFSDAALDRLQEHTGDGHDGQGE